MQHVFFDRVCYERVFTRADSFYINVLKGPNEMPPHLVDVPSQRL